MTKLKFLNTTVDNLTMNEAIEVADKLIQEKNNSYIVTPNVDHIVKLESDDHFRNVYKEANLVLTDGQPLIWLSKFLGTPIKEKISGSDFFPEICNLAQQKGYSIFLLGAAEGVAQKAADNLRIDYPGIKIAGVFSPDYGFEKSDKKITEIIQLINEVKPDILAVGLGAPKQEKFLYDYKEKLNVPLSMAIGASIDFVAGNVKRSPRWMQSAGLEWFYRLLKEPKRMFRRYLVDDLKILKIYSKYK